MPAIQFACQSAPESHTRSIRSEAWERCTSEALLAQTAEARASWLSDDENIIPELKDRKMWVYVTGPLPTLLLLSFVKIVMF